MKRYYTTKITRKGQITLPAEARRELGLDVGKHVTVVMEDGVLWIDPRSIVERTAGMLKWDGPPLSSEELDDVITNSWAEAAVERDERSKRGEMPE